MPGSASTLAFNLTREILVAATGRAWFAVEATSLAALEYELSSTWPEDIIIRAHNASHGMLALLRSAGARAVLSSRDPRDCVASLHARFGQNTALWCTDVGRSIAALETIRARWGAPVLAYDRVQGSLETLVADIAASLGKALPPAEIARIAGRWTREAVAERVSTVPDRGELTPSGLRQDRHTLLNERHLGDGRIGKWRDVLSCMDGHRVTQAFGDVGDLARPPVPGRVLRFPEALFGTAAREEGTQNLDPVSSIGLRLLCLCFLHVGCWRVTVRGTLPARYLPTRLHLVVGGNIRMSRDLPAAPPGSACLELPPDLSVSFDHRDHELNIELLLDGPVETLPDPFRPEAVFLEAVLEAP